MATDTSSLVELCNTLTELLQREINGCADELRSARTALQRAASQDARLRGIIPTIQAVAERLEQMLEVGQRDFLQPLSRAAGQGHSPAGSPADLYEHLLTTDGDDDDLTATVLDTLLRWTRAERGCLVVFRPESTEAEVVDARHFETTNLSLEEYRPSRSVLRAVLQDGETVRLSDARTDERFGLAASVRDLGLRSVLAVPLRFRNRPTGAIYLENSSQAGAFGPDDVIVVEAAARFATFRLYHSRRLPTLPRQDDRIFLDTERATREIVGKHPSMVELLRLIGRVAPAPASVLIEGESGTGKDLVARALHYESPRRDHPFVAINCAAIPEALLESELFGYERGAFTGADQRYRGRIEQGDGGTLFFDEIGELAYPLQAKLLRFLQSGEVTRLGGNHVVTVDIRVVAATSHDLESLVEAGRFQRALFYRLNVVPIPLPPLRERREDIPRLVDHFAGKYSQLYARRVAIAPEVTQRLAGLPFPGNVRELENLVHRLIAIGTEPVVRLGDLPPELLQPRTPPLDLGAGPHREASTLEELAQQTREHERWRAREKRRIVARAVEEAGSVVAAADRLGLHRVTVHRILRDDPGNV